MEDTTMNNVVNRALVAEKKSYFQPMIEVMSVSFIDTICAASGTKAVGVKDGSFSEEAKFF